MEEVTRAECGGGEGARRVEEKFLHRRDAARCIFKTECGSCSAGPSCLWGAGPP